MPVAIANFADVEPQEVRTGRGRNLMLHRFPLATGIPGVVIEFSRVVVPDGYYTPRHRHNFDQIRYTLSGTFSAGPADLAPGECAYFPEGAHYGPQDQKGDCVNLVLQFQGPSGERFLSDPEVRETYGGLVASGATFENGVYRGRTADGRPHNKDSYEAIWEEHEGRELVYPPPRYREPIFMTGERYRFLPDRKRPGLEVKHLGSFSEFRTGIALHRLRPGAALAPWRQEDAEIRYLLDGRCAMAGGCGPRGPYFFLPPDAEVAAMDSDAGATLYVIWLAMIAELQAAEATRLPACRAGCWRPCSGGRGGASGRARRWRGRRRPPH